METSNTQYDTLFLQTDYSLFIVLAQLVFTFFNSLQFYFESDRAFFLDMSLSTSRPNSCKSDTDTILCVAT